MASAVVFWHYQRRLSEGVSGGNQNEGHKTNMEEKTQRTRRLVSESSVTGYHPEETERRDSVEDNTDDETSPNEAGKPKRKRRFSLDFLFSRRKSKDKTEKAEKKLKTKRSQSTVESSETFAENYRPYRYPGAEFALAM